MYSSLNIYNLYYQECFVFSEVSLASKPVVEAHNTLFKNRREILHDTKFYVTKTV